MVGFPGLVSHTTALLVSMSHAVVVTLQLLLLPVFCGASSPSLHEIESAADGATPDARWMLPMTVVVPPVALWRSQPDWLHVIPAWPSPGRPSEDWLEARYVRWRSGHSLTLWLPAIAEAAMAERLTSLCFYRRGVCCGWW